jgi:cleavage and polyadenylation specificity factor subunit 4
VYDPNRMPLCQFIIDYGACHNPDCIFAHAKDDEGQEKQQKECIWYSRGFCKHGPQCKSKHIRREMCPDYLGQSQAGCLLPIASAVALAMGIYF